MQVTKKAEVRVEVVGEGKVKVNRGEGCVQAVQVMTEGEISVNRRWIEERYVCGLSR